jgi:hypothetical protein
VGLTTPHWDATQMVGRRYYTPWKPSGLVEVVSVAEGLWDGRVIVAVRFVGNHPNGYRDGDFGFYLADELFASVRSC